MQLISVVISTYNNQQYIKRAICSILNGSYKNIEIIVVNNGSSDNTKEIVAEIIENDPRVKYIHLDQNVGIFAGRIEGMKVATGEYIGFSDSDDFYEKNAFEVLYNATQKYQADIVTARTVNNKNNHIALNTFAPFSIHENENVLKSYLVHRPYSNLWCALFHRDLVTKALACYPQNVHMLGGEDYVHSIFLHFFAKKKVQITTPIYNWWKNTDSISMSYSSKNKHSTKVWDDYQNVFLIVEKFLHDQNKYDVFSMAWGKFITKQMLPLYIRKGRFDRRYAYKWQDHADVKFVYQLLLQFRATSLMDYLDRLPTKKQIILCIGQMIWAVKHIIKIIPNLFKKDR